MEELRADHRRWEASWEAGRSKRPGNSEASPPDKLDVRLWPAVTFTGPPIWVVGTLVLAVAVVIGLSVTTWKVAIKRIELLRGIWADSKEVNEWRGKLGSAIAGVTKIALWVPALVVAVVLLAAVVAYRGTSCEAGGCVAVTPSGPAAPQVPVVVYLPAPSAPGAPPSSPTSTNDARSDAVRWQLQAEEWRREAAAARNDLAGLRRGDADSAGAAHVWIAALSFLLGAAGGGVAIWLVADRLNWRPRTEPDRDRKDARPSTTTARTRAVATYDDLKSVEQAEDLRLLGLRAALWRDQIASAWKRLEESLKRQPAPGEDPQKGLPTWLAALQGDASLLQRRLQEIVDFTSRPDDGER